jgi:Domain of unknown function (DUF4168)
MKLSKTRLLLVVASISMFFVMSSAPLVMAASMQGNAAPASKVSDRELKAFAKAYVEYHQIKRSYEPKVKTMKDEKTKQQVKKEGNNKVLHALEKQGLTPQKYNQLFAAVNKDPQLREKALDLIEAERRNS